MSKPILLGVSNNRVNVRTRPTGLSGEPRVQGIFRPYFGYTFAMNVFARSPVEDVRGRADRTSLFSLNVRNKTASFEFFSGAFGSSTTFKKEEHLPEFDKYIASLTQCALKYQEPGSRERMANRHLINRTKNFEALGQKVADIGSPFFRHVMNEPEKINEILDYMDRDIHDHIKDQGFGPTGWLQTRSTEFLDKFKRNRSISAAPSAYTSTFFQSLLQGVPDKHMTDLTLDFAQQTNPVLYQNMMNLRTAQIDPNTTDEAVKTLLVNTNSPERKSTMVHSYYQNHAC